MNQESHHDHIIIGAGPAGLQLGYYMEKEGRDYLILEAGEQPGEFFRKFPRHRTLLSINKVHTGCTDREMNYRWDWNSLLSDDDSMLFKNYSDNYFPDASELKDYLVAFAKKFSLKVTSNAKIVRISKGDIGFRLLDQQGRVYTCGRLIVATGLSKPYVPQIPGIELGENYTEFPIDRQDFVDQRILIIGKGNSAFETADHLIEVAASIQMSSPNPVKLAWTTHYVGHIRARNNNFLDTYQLKSQNTILDAYVEKIERGSNGQLDVSVFYTHAKGERRVISFDRVLICTGFRFDASVFDDSCRPDLSLGGRFPAQTSAWESTNVEDLYFAGTLTQVRDYKKTMSGFIHGFRYNAQTLNRILATRYDDEPWPCQVLPAETDLLVNTVLERINRSSSIFLQPGFFCDMIVVPDSGDRVKYYPDLPIEYAHESDFDKNGCYYTISMEYGDLSSIKDPFDVDRDPDPAKAHLAFYIHPVIRTFRDGKLIAEHHVPEDLENVYTLDIHKRIMADVFYPAIEHLMKAA